MGKVSSSSSSVTPILLLVIRLLLGLVFTGWLMMWVVMPTNVYRNSWQPMLRTATDSTYFDRQGTNILIFTFPILLVAALGCVYLHLSKRSDVSRSLSRRLDSWKRPFVVRGPLGVLSGMEVAFGLMFLALIAWSLCMYLITGFARITLDEGEKLWEAKLDSAGLRFGLVGNLCCAFLFFPISRGSSLMQLIGLTSEASIKYHVWLGHIVMAFFTAHGLCYIVFWGVTGQISQMLKWDPTDVANIAGELALLAGLIMWSTTIPRIRRRMFELFFYTHHLYILFLFFYLMHVGITYFCYILPGVYLFMVDRYLRFLQSRQRVRLLSARLLPSETVELNFAKSPGFSYTPMSSVFINVPTISSLQWHPFTVSSSSGLEPERLSVIIKKEGRWSQKLYEMLTSPSLDRLDVSVEGPYGPVSVDFSWYDTLVMVSGGSGITPFISIIRELIHHNTAVGVGVRVATPNIVLICTFKTSDDLMMLDLLLPVSGNVSDHLFHLQLRVEAFVTQENAPSDLHKLIRTLWFKPNPTDVPVAPVLGSNGWLWLAAIISSSFMAFLLIMGLVTRYYIYPIDKNTNKIYSYTSRSLLNLLIICVCIVATASTAMLWNKRGTAMEVKHVQVMDAASPTTQSPSSWFYNADRELESVPSESLSHATKVRYGRRPDLKKLLLELEGSSIGVMASGPRGMRHDVAAICSSGQADHLHFESISFNW